MIRIEIKRAEKVQGIKALFITFPYNAKILNTIRQFMIRWWHPDTKEWELKYEYLDKIKELLNEYEIDIANTYDINHTTDLNNEAYTYIPKDYKFKIQPFKHQIEGIEYGLNYDRFLLGDEQRLAVKQCKLFQLLVLKRNKKSINIV